MHECPNKPRRESADLAPPDDTDCGGATDRGDHPFVTKAKGRSCFSLKECMNRSGDMAPLLHCNRSNTGEGFLPMIKRESHISCDKNSWIARNGKIRLDANPARSVS